MSFTQLIFRKGNYLSTVELDVVITESTTATARMTEHQIESGAIVSDHIIVDPMSHSMEGVVSNISSTIFGQSLPKIGIKKAQEAWEALLKVMADKEPFFLRQGIKTYPNTVLLSLTGRQDKDTSNGLFFSATMKQLIMVGDNPIEVDQFTDDSIAAKMVRTVSGGLKQLRSF